MDTYAYFGEPVYVYSLKEGINDGFFTPFKVQQIATTLDDYVYTADDAVLEGEVEAGKRYTESDFNNLIDIKEREAYRVKLFMEMVDQKQKAIVFCATQDHALAVRDLINQYKTHTDPNYCVRVTANDGAEGERWLRVFQDNEKTIPSILTTSQKLSTGVDARNVRNIILMRPVNSMIEFKQIVGRGTRLFDGKDYFTLVDFVKAYEHFSDPEWDGDPLDPVVCEQCGTSPCSCAIALPTACEICGLLACECVATTSPCDDCAESPCVCEKKTKLVIKLADGKERTIQSMTASSFWSADGTPISSAQFIERLYGELPELFKSEDELRAIWSQPDTRKKLLDGLEEKGYGIEQLAELSRVIEADNSDLYDVLAYVSFAVPTVTREERVSCQQDKIYCHYSDKQQQFLSFVLDHYVSQGVGELDKDKLPNLLELKYDSIRDAMDELGAVPEISQMFVGFQKHLYADLSR